MTATIQATPTASVLRHRVTAPTVVGMLAFVISVAGIGIPSLWYDEVATVTSATRTLPQLWQELGNIDAVHGLYYLVMHFWFQLVGYSPFTLRLPSALAVGAAAALIVLLGRQLGSPRFAVLGGIVFALLPRTTWMGSEGRSYAATALLAVAVTLALVVAVRGHSARLWILYGTLAVLATVFFVYLALVLVAHAVTIGWWLLASRGHALPSATSWLRTAVVALAAMIPFGLAVVGQQGQLYWLKPIGPTTLHQVLVEQWFFTSLPFAWLGWAALAIGAVLLVRRATGFSAAAVLLPAMLLPTAALLLATALYSPIYTPRYVSMCLPFVALVIAAAIDRAHSKAVIATALAIASAIGLQQTVEQRMPDAKEYSSWEAVASSLAADRAEDGPESTAGILYGTVMRHPTATTRVIAYAYPDAFAGTVDLTLQTPAAQTGQLWETTEPLGDSLGRLADVDAVYLLTSTERDPRREIGQTLGSAGWRLMSITTVGLVDILRYTRG